MQAFLVRGLRALLLSPVYFLVGCYVIAAVTIRSGVRIARRARSLPAALASTLLCPLGHENDATGRFECLDCKATYMGWVGRCGHCGAGASYVACSTCGCAITLRWERP